MVKADIGLIAAMPEEINPLLRRIGRVRREKLAGFQMYRFSTDGKDVCLIESGIGGARATQATHALIGAAAPGLIINFGFAGAVLPGLAVGDIVVATRLLYLRELLFAIQPGLSSDLTARIIDLLEKQRQRIHSPTQRASFVTTAKIIDKGLLAKLLPAGTEYPVLEMETAAIAQVAHEKQIPLASIRAISDGADEELDFSIQSLTDPEMHISRTKVIKAIIARPMIVPQLARLALNSRKAGKNLAIAIETALGLSR